MGYRRLNYWACGCCGAVLVIGGVSGAMRIGCGRGGGGTVGRVGL